MRSRDCDPAGEVVVLSTINMIRSLFGSAAAGERRRAGLGRRFWPAFAIAALLLGQSSFSARADIEDFYVFKSVLSSGNANWCIDIPGADYQPGKGVLISRCLSRAAPATACA